MKICKDCKHFKNYRGSIPFGSCSERHNIEISDTIDIISGEKVPPKLKWEYASTCRLYGRFSSFILRECGKGGRFWEAK